MQLEFGGRRYPVAAGDFVIGSGSDSSLVLTAPGVLPRHAVIRPLGPGMAVVVPALPGAEILVNGARLGNDPTPLMHGDKIRIGGQEITVADPRRAGATQVRATAQPTSTADGPPSSNREPFPERSGPPAARLVSLTDGREYSLRVVPFVIGRDAGSGVVVEADEVSRRHAEILPSTTGDWLVDQSVNGVWVNGDRVRSRMLLKSGDVIRVATEELRYYPAEPVGPPTGAELKLADTMVGMPALRRAPPVQSSYLAPSQPALASLLVQSGERKGDRVSVRTPVVNIGRAEYNDVRLPDSSISASHAKLQLREGVWMLTDLGSTNGTKVDGEAVLVETPLSPGATIRFGEVTVAFEPKDRGVAKGSGTVILEVPLPAAPPPAPGPLAGARRQPVAPAPIRRSTILMILLLVAALAATFLLLG